MKIDRNSIWTTGSGERVAIKDMTDSHLNACIELIRLHLLTEWPWRKKYLAPMIEEQKLRKELAASPLGRALE